MPSAGHMPERVYKQEASQPYWIPYISY